MAAGNWASVHINLPKMQPMFFINIADISSLVVEAVAQKIALYLLCSEYYKSISATL